MRIFTIYGGRVCLDPEHEGDRRLAEAAFPPAGQKQASWRCHACRNRKRRGEAENRRRRDRYARNRHRERDNARVDAGRQAVLEHYGRVCACCGATEGLSVDHVGGRAPEHRHLPPRDLRRWLVVNGFPPGFQLLCIPCNSSKGRGARCRIHAPAA